jgi:hypothetical protein
MGLHLDTIVPWGRSYDEYRRMFDLTADDLHRRILGCADGPAGFNAVLSQRGGAVTSVDPLYAFTASQIRHRIQETYDIILEQLRLNHADYVWDVIPSVDALGAMRMAAMETFLADYEAGQRTGRYVTGQLPELPFEGDRFDLALVSHFLFLYHHQLSADFHHQALRELLRVASEVRVFPLVTLEGQPSPALPTVTAQLTGAGYTIDVRTVPYEFQRGGHHMLVIRRGGVS